MYYAYSAMSGRIVRASHLRAFVPQGLQALRSVTVPEVASLQPRVMKAATIATNVTAQAAVKHKHSPLDPKFKYYQELFQKNEDTPVYLLRGTTDKAIYYTIFGVILTALAYILYNLSIIIYWP